MQESERDAVAYSKSLLQIYDSCGLECLHEVVTGEETCALLWTWENSTEQSMGAQRWKPTLNHKEKLIWQTVLCTFFSNSKGIVLKNHVKRRASPGNTWESVLTEVNIFIWERKEMLACVVPNFFMIMYLLTSASSCRSMLWMRILKLCFTLPPPLTLHFVTFHCSNITKKVFLGKGSTEEHPLDQTFSSIFHMYPRSSSNRYFCGGRKTFKVCGSRWRVVWKVAVEERRLRSGEHTLHHILHTKMKWLAYKHFEDD